MYTPQKFVDACRISMIAVVWHICPDVWNIIAKYINFVENGLMIEMRILAGVPQGASDENIKNAFEAKFIECTPKLYQGSTWIFKTDIIVPTDNGDKLMYIDTLTWQQKITHVTEVSSGIRYRSGEFKPFKPFIFEEKWNELIRSYTLRQHVIRQLQQSDNAQRQQKKQKKKQYKNQQKYCDEQKKRQYKRQRNQWKYCITR